MKFFVLFLIVANLLVFAWIRQHESAGAAETDPQVAGIPSGMLPLQLLSELKPEEAEQPSSQQVSEEPAVTVTQETDTVVEEETETAAVETQIAKVELPEQVTQNAVCQTVGPFINRAILNDGTAWLKQHGREGEVRSEESRQLRDYWVYLPSMSAEDAERTVGEFEQKGVKDYYRGRLNEISLGIYSKEDVADRRRMQIAALGYAPVLAPRYRDRTLYWLDLNEPEVDVLTDEEWAGFLVNHPDITRRRVTCP